MRPVLYLATTSHGFGHAVRTAAVAAKVQELLPETRLIFVTMVPEWLLACYVKGEYELRRRKLDIGVVQKDSFTMDKQQTLAQTRNIRQTADTIIAEEAKFLRENQAQLILADIPPLAASIARAADIPCWFMGNFGWDFIYRDWGAEFIAESDWITAQYDQGDRLFRLPFHEPMAQFPNITDVGLIGDDPNFLETELRETFALTKPKDKTILLTFGGLGLDGIPYDTLAQFPDYQFITFDRQAPDLDNLCKINNVHYRPIDFFPLCDRLVSKPGFGTFSEAMRQDLPIATLPRADFAEAPVLLEAIQNYSPHQILDPSEFRQGNWDFLRQPPDLPTSDVALDKNGTEAIARAIVTYLTHKQ